jgi:hypothetical protein
MGMATVRLQAVEIENSFVSSLNSDDSEPSSDWSDIDPTGAIAPVGRMVTYKGNGLEMSITAGIKIAGLRLGFCYSWINASFSGFSKRYMYVPELLRAGGTPFYDTSSVSIHRLMSSIKYGIPIRKFRLNFQTRLGVMIVGNTPLVVGRAVEDNNAFSGDFGLEFTMRPSKWFSVGVLGYAGAFAFPGKYDGAFGVITGVDGTLGFYF